MNIKYRQTCRICGNPHLTDVLDLGYQYFQGSFIKEGVPNPPTRKTPNQIVRCDTSKWENACGLVQTRHTIPPRILYTNYWYQSGISNTMREHLQRIVWKTTGITNLYDGTVLDIAMNDGTLLRNYSENFKKIGIDPCDITSRQKDKDIKIINDLFPTKLLEEKDINIITSIACYYDVENPCEFAQEIKKILHKKGIWIFEVAYWPSMLKNLSYDSCVNEHIIHYHLAPIEIMMKACGLKVFDAELTDTNGGSIMCYITHDDCHNYDSENSRKRLSEIRLGEFNAALDDESTYEIFRSRVLAHKTELNKLLKQIRLEGKTIHIYGSSTKLNTILGYCEIGTDLIQYAAERSPEKVGATTISGIKLISEEESRNMKPDYYFIGPYHFKAEILERETEFRKNGGKFIFPLPKIEIV